MSAALSPASRRTARRFDPFWPAWRLLTSVRFAVVLIGCLALASLSGVLIPQAPSAVRDDPQRLANWLALEHGKFGPFTMWMYRLGLFNVFGTFWFRGALGVLVLAVAVCTYNRFPATWRTIRHPQKRVPDAYLRRARHRAEFAAPADTGALERVLRRRHYRVQRFEENGEVRLFADRFQWALLGTFASHLALIIFIAGGLVTLLTGYEAHLTIAEGRSAPVFPVEHPGQMQVYVDNAVGKFGDDGRPLDYRSFLTIYKDGQEAKHCVATVNQPCQFAGYRFSQSAFFGFGAELSVKDTATGRTLYDEIIPLGQQSAAPQLVIRDRSGSQLFSGTVVLQGAAGGAPIGLLSVPGSDTTLLAGLQRESGAGQWALALTERNTTSLPALMHAGDVRAVADLSVQFVGVAAIPAALLSDIPVPPGASSAADGKLPLLLQMGNATFGTSEASSGRAVETSHSDLPQTLTITGLGNDAVSLRPGESAVSGGYEYTFTGQKPFSGIQVKWDRGATFIWVALGLLVFGMAVTFHVPRRRLWAQVAGGRVYIAGLAGPLVDLSSELRGIGVEAGSPDVVLEDDNDAEDDDATPSAIPARSAPARTGANQPRRAGESLPEVTT